MLPITFQQVLAVALDRVRPRPCSRWQRVRHTLQHDLFDKQVGIAEDGGHGGADFVAHVGQELALGAVGGVGGVLGLAQIVFHALPFGDVVVNSHNATDVPLGIQ